MRDQLLLLAELQALDDHISALVAKQAQLPLQLQPHEVACDQESQKLEHLQADIGQSERQQRASERELADSHVALNKTQAKLRDIKTNKEYSAVLVEVAAVKQRVTELEDGILQLMEQTEQQWQLVQVQEQCVRAARQQLQEHKNRLQEAQESLRQQMMREQEKRHKATIDLDSKLYETYQHLATHYGGRAVVQLRAGVCSGCHLRISPQLAADIRLQQQLYTCPHCRLLLLWLD